MSNEELKELLEEYNQHLICGENGRNAYFLDYIPELIEIILEERKSHTDLLKLIKGDLNIV